MLRRFFGFSIIPLLVLACSHDETASAKTRDGHSDDGGVAPRPAVISPAAEPYKVVAVATPSSITGTVDFGSGTLTSAGITDAFVLQLAP